MRKTMIRRSFARILLALGALALAGCAALQGHDSIQVAVAGIDPIPGEGLELRMMVRLRVQNPNDAPIDYDGVYLRLSVLDKTFATGVSDARGRVPRFGETVIAVPVTVSTLGLVRQALGLLDGKPTDKVSYELEGKLAGPALGAVRFQSQGELALPKSLR